MPRPVSGHIAVEIAILSVPLDIYSDAAFKIIYQITFLIEGFENLGNLRLLVKQVSLSLNVQPPFSPITHTEKPIKLFCDIAPITTCPEPSLRIQLKFL